MALEVNKVAGLGAFVTGMGAVEEVIGAHFGQSCQRSEGGNMAANIGVVLVLAHNHGDRVPANQRLDLLFKIGVARVGDFLVHRDGVAVSGIEAETGCESARRGAFHHLIQEVTGPFRAFFGENVL